MRPGWTARRFIAGIERYRSWGGRRGSGCRFDPSCSTFALEAFRTRTLPIALASSAWRIVRCNPLVSSGTGDPVPRRPLRPRPNGPATSFTILAASGLLVFAWTAIAFAQGVTGGCSANINGVDPATMTRKDPLLVSEGQVVSVQGTVPPDVQSLPRNQVQSNTTITVSIVEGVADVSSESHPGEGYSWGGQVNVDDYLRWGVGLYKVEGVAAGTPDWSCTGSGYIKLDGNPLSKPAGQAAAGVALVGVVGALASTLPKRKNAEVMESSADLRPTAQDVKEDFGKDVDKLLGVKPKPSLLDSSPAWNVGCAVLVLCVLIASFLSGFAAVAPPARRRRVWAHGHTVLGAISGLLLGLGLAVLGQQFALWPLTVLSAIVFPVTTSILCGVRAYLGRPYAVGVAVAPAAPPMPP